MTRMQVSTWFANARRRLKKENKMTWEPRNKTNDGHDSDDKESIAGSEDGSSSCDVQQQQQQHHGNGCATRNGTGSSNDRNRNHRSDHTIQVPTGSASPVSHHHNHHYPIVKTEGLTTMTDLSCTDKRSTASLLNHHPMSGNSVTQKNCTPLI